MAWSFLSLWGSFLAIVAPIQWRWHLFFFVAPTTRETWDSVGEVLAGLLLIAGLLMTSSAALRAELQSRTVRKALARRRAADDEVLFYLRRRRAFLLILPLAAFLAAGALSRLRLLDQPAFIATAAGSMLALALMAALENQRLLLGE